MKLGASITILPICEGICPAEAIEVLGDGGFEFADYNFQTDTIGRDAPLRRENWRAYYRDLAHRAQNANVHIHQTHGLTHNYFEKGEMTRTLNTMIDRTLEATAILGADVIVFHPVAPVGLECDEEAACAVNEAFIREKALIAQQFGVRIAVENMISTWIKHGGVIRRCCTDSASLRRLVGRIGTDNVGICLDIGHLHYMEEDEASAIRACADHLIALHIHDNDRVNDEHLTPFSGTVRWDAVCAALRDVQFSGVFSLEIHKACRDMPPALRQETLKHIHAIGEYLAALSDSANMVSPCFQASTLHK